MGWIRWDRSQPVWGSAQPTRFADASRGRADAFGWPAQGVLPAQRGFRILADGLFACLLMRELDGLFDPISHSAWCWPFSLIGLVCVWKAFKPGEGKSFFEALATFTREPMFGSMATGLGVLIFSRIFGMVALWHIILSDGYARLAKTTVEEGIELLTYSMCYRRPLSTTSLSEHPSPST